MYVEAVAHVRDVQNAHKTAGGLALGETDDSVLLMDSLIYDFPVLEGPEGGGGGVPISVPATGSGAALPRRSLLP